VKRISELWQRTKNCETFVIGAVEVRTFASFALAQVRLPMVVEYYLQQRFEVHYDSGRMSYLWIWLMQLECVEDDGADSPSNGY
jgi:hypothetical protein